MVPFPAALRITVWVWGLALLVAIPGCRSERPPPAAPGAARVEHALDVASLGSDRKTTLRALRMPHRLIAARLGAHRLVASSRLTTQLPSQPAREVVQEVSLRVDGKGQYAALKTTGAQYGQEVIWTGGWLYPRLRYSKFLRRRAEADEPALMADRLAGLLPAYVTLLRRFLEVHLEGRGQHQGREVVRVRLSLASDPRPPAPLRAPARQWRRTLVARAIEGKAVLDAQTGAPLSVELTARWTFSPPAAGPLPDSGLPTRVDEGTTATGELHFTLKVSDLGKVATVRPPPEAETIDSPRLVRTELERQMLTGEVPLEGDREGDADAGGGEGKAP